MRRSWIVVTAVACLLNGSLRAQGISDGLGISLGISHLSFAGGASDAETAAAGIRPANGLAFDVGVDWNQQGWMVSLATGVASGPVQSGDAVSGVEYRTVSLHRYHLAGSFTRWLVRGAGARFGIGAGPLLDRWTGRGLESNTAIGGEAHLLLAFPVGKIELENRATLGWESSPFTAADLGPGARRGALRTLAIGLAMRYRP